MLCYLNIIIILLILLFKISVIIFNSDYYLFIYRSEYIYILLYNILYYIYNKPVVTR